MKVPIDNFDFHEDNLDSDFLGSDDGMFLLWAQGLYKREYELQVENRNQRSIDCGFYDGDQFSDEELAVYEARGQTPRVYNEVKPTIDWILGSERRTRMDYAVLPRTENDSDASLRKTKLCKYVDDINKSKWQRSLSFEDMVKSGEGWTRVGYEINDDGDYQILLKHVPWRNILSDSSSHSPLMNDDRYVWETKVIDLSVLMVHFPDKLNELYYDAEDKADLENDVIEESLLTSDGRHTQRIRSGVISLHDRMHEERRAVRVYEMWYKQPEKVKIIKGESAFNGEIFDENNPQHIQLIQYFDHKVREVVRQQIYCAMYTNNTLLYRQKSPYKHNRLPYIKRSCYIRNKDGAAYGVVRQIRDPQSDLNIRRNKALFQLATNRIIMDKDAVEDKNNLVQEVARWDSVIEKKAGAYFEIQEGSALANQHIAVGEQNSAYIRQVSGVTGENRGMSTNANSGVAIQARQEQGTVITTVLTDNHILARQLEGELILSLIEQFMDKPMQFRITADDLKEDPEFVDVNQEDDPTTDITKTQADFIVADKDYRSSMRQALSEQLIATAGVISQHTGNPMLGVALLISAIEMQDIPEKSRMTEELRKAAGMPPKNETDEQQQAREALAQQQAELEKQKQDLIMRESMAQIAKLEAEANKVNNEAELQKLRIQIEKLRAMLEAIQLGNGAIASPREALTVADDLINNADAVLNLNNKQVEPVQIPTPQPQVEQQLQTEQPPIPQQQF
ncbi:hypothetical protein [Acinetobacter sp. CFCC 10889]|uniref:portal protein n=1 Tax=Acinetobacter sp. CFCC 10889 TaxID=1775557 RepID=UPI000DD0C1AF|nr:hypothetical protein [Acinetobacter sp. CFCC 10889]